MGITVHYRGQFADLDRVEDFEDRVLDLMLDLGGKAQVWRSTADGDPSRIVRGLLVDLEPGQETLSLLVSPEGWLIAPLQIEAAARGELTQSPWCFCQTQCGSITGHVAVVELLAAIRKEFLPQLEVRDEAGYFESRGADQLAGQQEFLNRAATEFASGMTQGLTAEAAEDTNILRTRIQRIAAKVQRTIRRPSEHPPLTLGDDDFEDFGAVRDVAATEAQYDELFKHTERRKEQLHRAIVERLQRGEDHSTAFENAMRDIGLSVPDDPDWPVEEDAADFADLLDAETNDSDDDDWSETGDKAAAEFTDELEPDEREDHPLLQRATELWITLTEQFADTDAAHDQQLRTLFRGLGDLVGGLAQATSRAFERDEEEHEFSPMEEIQFGLTVTQLKRSLRGIAFARGALGNLRAAIEPANAEQFQNTLKSLNEDLVEELHRVRDRFQGPED